MCPKLGGIPAVPFFTNSFNSVMHITTQLTKELITFDNILPTFGLIVSNKNRLIHLEFNLK